MKLSLTALFVAVTLAGTAFATPPVAPPPASHAKVLLVGMAGTEDMQRLIAPYHHAVLMKQSGKAEAVAIVIYGRAVFGLVRAAKGLPDKLRGAQQAALAAGIPIYVCEHSLEMNGISRDALIPGVAIVPSGAVKIAEEIGEGFTPIQY